MVIFCSAVFDVTTVVVLAAEPIFIGVPEPRNCDVEVAEPSDDEDM